jgi:hypothetical protein
MGLPGVETASKTRSNAAFLVGQCFSEKVRETVSSDLARRRADRTNDLDEPAETDASIGTRSMWSTSQVAEATIARARRSWETNFMVKERGRRVDL